MFNIGPEKLMVLADELGPEFAEVDLDALRDLRALNARAAISRALSVEDDESTVAPMTDTPAAHPAPSRRLGRAEKAPFDTDAT